MSEKKYFINSLYISNFKPFPCQKPPKKIFFSDATNKIIKFMMLSGFNGYGKTSIFQAIEFVLSGKIEIFEFKDTTKKYSEHMIINELNKESLVAIELFNPNKKEYFSIIRYNEKVETCKETECKTEFKDFELYVLYEKFNYTKFIGNKNQKEISSIDTYELAKKLEENNIDEWLNTNYIKQEQSSNILFKNNSERVDFINKFIDESCEKHFYKFKEEEKNLKEKIAEVKATLTKLKGEIKDKQVAIIGEKPKNANVFKGLDIFWDKEKYDFKEDFEKYLQKVNSLSEFVKNNEIYDNTDKSIEIKEFLCKPDLLKESIIYSYFEDKMDAYIFNYKKKQYLEALISNKKALLTNKLELKYLSKELVYRINGLKEKNENAEKLSDRKQKMYTQAKNFREYVEQNIDTFDDLFGQICPLCGQEYEDQYEVQDKDKTLKQAVIDNGKIFKECNEVLNSSLKILEKEIGNEYKSILDDVKIITDNIDFEKTIYSHINNIKKDINKYRNDKEKLEMLMEENIDSENIFIELTFEGLKSIYSKVVSKLSSNLEKYKKWLSEIEENNFDKVIYQENKSYLPAIRKLDIEEIKNKIEMKKQYLKWLSNKKQLDQYSDNKLKFEDSSKNLKELLIRYKKVKKILESVKRARQSYLANLIKYIEIPLYIYSGKLMQTHQNGLGIFCTTGSSKDKVTQFKLTSNGDKDAHDILNKFSSGQKAAINMAVMLAFRKIRKPVFDLFMIDDPCQSMDDINVASLTEILKNEFEDTQILISTHEDSTAGYMCYKYNKTGKISKNLNVQKEFYSYKN